MFIRPSALLLLLPFILERAKADPLDFAALWQTRAVQANDSIPFSTCINTADGNLQTAEVLETYNWLTGNRANSNSRYRCLSSPSNCIYKIPLSNDAIISLNKGCQCTLNKTDGNLVGISGETYVETKYHTFWVFVSKKTAVCVNAHSQLNIKSYKNKKLTVSLIKGSFEVFHNRRHNIFISPGRQVTFNNLGKPVRSITCDTQQVICWTRNAVFMPTLD